MIKIEIVIAIANDGKMHVTAEPEYTNARPHEHAFASLLQDHIQQALKLYCSRVHGGTVLNDVPDSLWNSLKNRQDQAIREQTKEDRKKQKE